MQKKIIKIFILFSLISILKLNVNATETMDDNSFVEYKNAIVDQYGNEYITEVDKILVGEFTLTAYCPCSQCCGKETGITASGAIATANHTIAADTSVFPFGTELIINGEKYTVEDVGGAIKGNHIDVFFNTHSEALTFGRKTEKIYKEEEKIVVLKPVEFREYMLITGDLMKRKIAESEYNKETGKVTWKTKRGEILALRTKNNDGIYENRVESNTYDDWVRSR